MILIIVMILGIISTNSIVITVGVSTIRLRNDDLARLTKTTHVIKNRFLSKSL